jgi:hypothetical protein
LVRRVLHDRAMKRIGKVAKLKLDKQVLRSLTASELDAAGGVIGDGCPRTVAGSGCSSYGTKCYQMP